MAGHSKWAQIKRKKGVNDQKRSAVFAKMSKAITLAVQEGGGIGNPDLNFKLRIAVEKAKYAEMPKENIQRAIDKAAGPDKQILHHVVYEAFGPYGTAFMIVVTTDNTNRTIADLRMVLERNGGKLGSIGSVGYLFEKCGVATFDKARYTMDDILLFSERIGASDIVEETEIFVVYVPFEQLGKIRESLDGLEPLTIDEDYRALNDVLLANESEEADFQKIMDVLEEQEDVQAVYTNAKGRGQSE